MQREAAIDLARHLIFERVESARSIRGAEDAVTDGATGRGRQRLRSPDDLLADGPSDGARISTEHDVSRLIARIRGLPPVRTKPPTSGDKLGRGDADEALDPIWTNGSAVNRLLTSARRLAGDQTTKPANNAAVLLVLHPLSRQNYETVLGHVRWENAGNHGGLGARCAASLQIALDLLAGARTEQRPEATLEQRPVQVFKMPGGPQMINP